VIETPRPTVAHGIVCKNVVVLLDRWAEAHDSAFVVCNDSGMLTEHGPDTVRGPDVFLFRESERDSLIGVDGYLHGPPLLVVEVLSPRDRWQDVIAKIDEYFSAGTKEVWIVEPELRQIQQQRMVPPPLIHRDDDQLSTDILPGFVTAASACFRGLPV
jgi:Uma2 family endonuclease